MSSITYVTTLPDCDFCRHPSVRSVDKRPAKYDFKTTEGQWANGCQRHYLQKRMYPNLGTGMGQELRVGEKPVESVHVRRQRIHEAVAAGDYDTAEDLIGDGDPAEWL